MVNRLRNESGKGRLGCLVWLLIADRGGLLRPRLGFSYIAYNRMSEEMQTQAGFAPPWMNGAIRRLPDRQGRGAGPAGGRESAITNPPSIPTARNRDQTRPGRSFWSCRSSTRAVTYHPVARAPL